MDRNIKEKSIIRKVLKKERKEQKKKAILLYISINWFHKLNGLQKIQCG